MCSPLNAGQGGSVEIDLKMDSLSNMRSQISGISHLLLCWRTLHPLEGGGKGEKNKRA